MFTRRSFLKWVPWAAGTVALTGCRHVTPSPPTGVANTPASKPARNPLAPPRLGFSARSGDLAHLRPASVTCASPKTCRILQFTDLHFFHDTPAKDEATLADCQRQIAQHQPDLVVVSGDIWHDNPQGKGQGYLEFAVQHFERWGVPWTTCWGNHDLVDDFQRAHDLLAGARGSCYRGTETHGDYRVELRAAAASANVAPVLDVYFLNSNADGLGPWQARALGQMVGAVKAGRTRPAPALAFFHIALCDYETRLTGTNFLGVKLEGAAHGKEAGETFPVLAAAGTIRACFCGHSHTNDYVVRTGSVDLHFGRSTGYAGYGGDKLRKGAKLIVVDLTKGTYEQRSVFVNETTTIATMPLPTSPYAT